MTEPAGTGLTRRKPSPASAGPGACRLRRLEDPDLRLRPRIAQADQGDKILSRSSFEGGNPRHVLAGRATRDYARCGEPEAGRKQQHDLRESLAYASGSGGRSLQT